MNKKYLVRLSDEERASCQDIVKNLKGSSQKFRRAQILLKADADGPAWPDLKIAEAFKGVGDEVEFGRDSAPSTPGPARPGPWSRPIFGSAGGGLVGPDRGRIRDNPLQVRILQRLEDPPPDSFLDQRSNRRQALFQRWPWW